MNNTGNTNYGLTNSNQEMLRVLLDINRGLNTIERSTANTDRKVNQIHTILMNQVSGVTTTNHVVMPRRSERLKEKAGKKSSTPKKKSKTPETKSSFPFFT